MHSNCQVTGQHQTNPCRIAVPCTVCTVATQMCRLSEPFLCSRIEEKIQKVKKGDSYPESLQHITQPRLNGTPCAAAMLWQTVSMQEICRTAAPVLPLLLTPEIKDHVKQHKESAILDINGDDYANVCLGENSHGVSAFDLTALAFQGKMCLCNHWVVLCTYLHTVCVCCLPLNMACTALHVIFLFAAICGCVVDTMVPGTCTVQQTVLRLADLQHAGLHRPHFTRRSGFFPWWLIPPTINQDQGGCLDVNTHWLQHQDHVLNKEVNEPRSG